MSIFVKRKLFLKKIWCEHLHDFKILQNAQITATFEAFAILNMQMLAVKQKSLVSQMYTYS